MDSLTYKYDTLNQRRNRLLRLVDNVPATRYGTYAVLNSLSMAINYVYDPIGNLISDDAEKITSIKWNVYGKISEINRTSTTGNTVTRIVYNYDASGNRISSVTTRSGTSNLDYVWYVRDAQGNAIAVYKATGTSRLSTLTPILAERYIYGSSRLGSYNEQVRRYGQHCYSNILLMYY
jgi:YD repeat-containing protein